jgi:predicted nucleic acid-binding protein
MPTVLSDTSPVRALAHLGHLDWLALLFGQVILPPAVDAELRNPPAGLPAVDTQALPFIQVFAPGNQQRVQELLADLDAGEAEALALAEEVHADLVLMDEQAGRALAGRCGFMVLGTLGILLRAKAQGLCSEVRPLLDRLQQEIHFFVSRKLRAIILQQAGETESP